MDVVMTDELQQSAPESQHEKPSVAPEVIAPHSQQSNKSLWVILAVAIGLVCCCSVICLVAIGLGGLGTFGAIATEKAPIESVLGSYMKYMDAKDAKSAYALLSPRAQRQIPLSKVEELLEGNNYVVFEGYQSLSVGNLNISAAANTNPDVPQGTVANVTGTIKFKGGFQGTFTGVLEKVDGKWQIDSMYVVVPPDKVK